MSQMTPYVYSGPVSSVSLRVGARIVDVQLHPGKPVGLPADHPYTQALIAQKRLTPIAPEPVSEATSAAADNPPEDKPRRNKAGQP